MLDFATLKKILITYFLQLWFRSDNSKNLSRYFLALFVIASTPTLKARMFESIWQAVATISLFLIEVASPIKFIISLIPS